MDELTGSDELEQTGFWGTYKAGFGASPRAFRIGAVGGMLVLVRPLGAGLSLGYVPYGPDIPDPGDEPGSREARLFGLAEAVRAAVPRGLVFLRYDLPWAVPEGVRAPLRDSARLRPAGVEIQPRHTVILDLGRSDEELLASMHHKTRYNIGLAARRGVEVREGRTVEELDRFYAIKVESDRRDNIVTHSREYFSALLQTSWELTAAPRPSPGPEVRLLVARVGERTVGGIIVSFCGRSARYLHGASADEHRSTMFSYALQWAAIRLARELGCSSYDLYGIPPDADPGHPMHGLYRFKVGFGGNVVHRMGCYDVVFRAALYAALRLPERARYLYFKRLRRLSGPLRRRRTGTAPSL